MIQREDAGVLIPGLRETFWSATAMRYLLQKLTDMEPIRIPDAIFELLVGLIRAAKEVDRCTSEMRRRKKATKNLKNQLED